MTEKNGNQKGIIRHKHSMPNFKQTLTVEKIAQLVLAVFHDHVTSLETYWNAALKPVIRVLGPNPFEDAGAPTIAEAIDKLSLPTVQLVFEMNKLISKLEHDWSQRGIPPYLWHNLLKRIEQLRDFTEKTNHNPHDFLSLQTAAEEIVLLLNELKNMKIAPREILRKTLYLSTEVQHISCIFHLLQVEERVIDLQQEARILRDFFMSEITPKQSLSTVRFLKLVEKAITILEPMAQAHRVEIRIVKTIPPSKVDVIEADAYRAVVSLLSNAIKYSWTLPGEKLAWVNISGGENSDYIYVEFENWGVPIDPEEIKSDRIFQFLNRGRFSDDRARTGTGIGLWDARNVARRHGGDVTVKSRPSRNSILQAGPNVPYLTTVRFELPRKNL